MTTARVGLPLSSAEWRVLQGTRAPQEAGMAQSRSPLSAAASRPLRRDSAYLSDYARATVTRVPASTVARTRTSASAFANTLQGLASRVSPARLIGVRPYPMAIAAPSGQ